MSNSQKIAILGGGAAGLLLALRLLKRTDLNAEIILIEKAGYVGGLAHSFQVDGLWFDLGSHRLHPATSPQVFEEIQNLLGKDLLKRNRYGRIYLRERFIQFPFTIPDLLTKLPKSFALGVGRDMLKRPFQRSKMPGQNFADILSKGLGSTICHDFYFPYARKLWGIEPEMISALQAERRVSGNTIGKILKKVLYGHRASAGAGNRIFYYPRNGFGQICSSLAENIKALGGKILLNSSVEELYCEDDKNWRISVRPSNEAGEDVELKAQLVFSTIPVTTLGGCLRDSIPRDVYNRLIRLRFRAMVFAYFILNTDRFTPYDAHYFPDTTCILSRLSEPKNYYGATEPHGRCGLCAEIPCAPGDSLWSMPDEALLNRVEADLSRVGLPMNELVVKGFVKRVPFVYPIYDMDSDAHFTAVDDYLMSLEGLVSLGRQALFVHDNTHHTMEMALKAEDCIRPDVTFNSDRWAEYRKQFEEFVVVD